MSTTYNVERRDGEKFGLAVQRFLVTSVKPGGPADRAGLKKGMRISQINDTNIQHLTHMQITALIKNSGKSMRIIVGTPEVPPATQDAPAAATSTTTSSSTTNGSAKSDSAKPATPASSTAATAPAAPSQSLPQPRSGSFSAAAKEKPSTATAAAPKEPQQPRQNPPKVGESKKEDAQKPAPAPAPAAPTPKAEAASSSGSTEQKNKKQRVPDAEPKPIPTTQKMVVKDDKGNTVSVDAPLCTACSKPILTRYLEFDGGKYHRGCFTCKMCNASLASVGFSPSDNGLICQNCWAKENGLLCAGCGQMIVPQMDKPVQYVSINEKQYHKDCVKCSECGLAFTEGVPGPFMVGDAVLCKEHATARRRGGKTASAGVTQDTEDGKKLNAIFKASRTGWK